MMKNVDNFETIYTWYWISICNTSWENLNKKNPVHDSHIYKYSWSRLILETSIPLFGKYNQVLEAGTHPKVRGD